MGSSCPNSQFRIKRGSQFFYDNNGQGNLQFRSNYFPNKHTPAGNCGNGRFLGVKFKFGKILGKYFTGMNPIFENHLRFLSTNLLFGKITGNRPFIKLALISLNHRYYPNNNTGNRNNNIDQSCQNTYWSKDKP